MPQNIMAQELVDLIEKSLGPLYAALNIMDKLHLNRNGKIEEAYGHLNKAEIFLEAAMENLEDL